MTSAIKRCVDCVKQGVTARRKTPYPGPRCATHHRGKRFDRRNYSHAKHVLDTYGITSEEYVLIYESQGSVCAICQRARGIKRKLSVDHCHTTGVVRGLLCATCNKYVLGHSRDDKAFFERAIKYLEEPPAVRVIGRRIAPIESEKIECEDD